MLKLKTKLYKLLRWSEKYTKTDMVYLAKGGFWLTTGQFFATISAFLLALAYANFLPKESYGTYKYILSIAMIIGALSLTGLGTTIVRSTSRGFEGVFRTSFIVNLKWSFLVIVPAFLGSIYYYINDNKTLFISLIIIGLLSPLMQSLSFYGYFLNGKKEFKTSTIYNIYTILIPAFSLFLVVIFTDNPITIILFYFLSSIFIKTILHLKTLKKYNPNKKIDKNSVKYGKHLSVMNLIGVISNNLDSILIFHYIGPIQLAVYSFAKAIPIQFNFIKKAIKTLSLPKISEKNIDELKKTIPTKAWKIFLMASIIVLIYVISAPYIYKLIFPQYIESVIYSQVLSLFILFFPSLLFTQTLIAHMKNKELYITSAIIPGIKIVLLFSLLPFYGIWGAIVALLLTNFLHFIILLYLFKRL